MTAVDLNDPAARHQHLRERLDRLRASEEAERARVLYVPAVGWYTAGAPDVVAAAEWACRAAAAELRLPFEPALKWFRLGDAGDRQSDWPEGAAIRAAPGLAGYVFHADPTTIWLNASYCTPGASVTPPIESVVAHEAAHVADLLAGRGHHSSPILEMRAELTAKALVRGEPLPFDPAEAAG